MPVILSHAQSLPGRTEIALRRISICSTVVAFGCCLSALVGWYLALSPYQSVVAAWPPFLPGNAVDVGLCAMGLMFHWSTRPGLQRTGYALGLLVLAIGLSGFIQDQFNPDLAAGFVHWTRISGNRALALPYQPGVINGSIMIMAGLALLKFVRSRSAWLGYSAIFGAVILALSLFGLLTRLFMPGSVAPGISGLGSIATFTLGLAFTTAHPNSSFIRTLKSNNATGLIGRRLLIVTAVLPPALYLLQLHGDTPGTDQALEQVAFTTVVFTFVLLAVYVYSLRKLERLDLDKLQTERERDRLLQRVQEQAAQLQQEVSTRTKELKELYERHQLAIQGSHYGVWDWDVVNGRQIWDRILYQIYGLTQEEFSGTTEDWLKRIHPDDRARIRSLDWTALEPDENLAFEHRIFRNDGSIRHLHVKGQPQFDPGGRLVRIVGLVRDDTVEKEREGELSSLSERLQFVVSAAGYGVWEYDFKGDRLYWDDHLLKLHGLTQGEVKGGIETWRQRVHPEDWPEVQAHLNDVIAGRSSQIEPEYRITLPGGRIVYLQMRSYMIRQPDGSPMRLVGLNRDVTAERELREQLRISEERLRLVVGSNNDAVWDWDISGNRLHHDTRFADMLGGKLTDMPANEQEWNARVHPDDLAHTNQELLLHLENKSPYYQCEYRMRHANGSWVWVLDRGKVVARDGQGKPMRMVGTQTDVSVRKALEEKLRHNEQLSLQLNRLAQIGAWEMDTATGRFTWAPEVYRIHEVDLGYTPDENSIERFYPAESRTVLNDAFRLARQDGTPFDLELPFTTARGHQLWIRILGQAETIHGQISRLFGGFQDITARRDAEEMRRQLESQLFQAQKMETLGTLAGGIAHDFNNLLTGILGYQDLAFDGLPADHESRPYLEASRDASLRARELVDQILTFSRQTGSKKIPVDLTTVVEDACRFLRATIPATIRIEVSTSADCALVLADASQIYQVLLNLGSNASYAMHKTGGEMRITLSPTQIAESSHYNQLAPGNYVRLDFSDTGHGMDEGTQKRIFDPFFTTKEVGQGTGLGLSMVHGILQAHGGTITVESSEENGTTFSLFLPVAEAMEPTAVVTDLTNMRGNGELVAIVDDEDLVRNFAQISLERAGYRVLSFDRGTTCLEEIRSHIQDFAVLLTDQTMPGISGMELVSEIRSLASTLPVIIMSGYYSRISPDLLEQMGHVALISKPFTTDELAHTVARSIRQSIPDAS